MKPNFNLEDLKRENVYHVPDAYFDKLPNRIMQRVTASPETSVSGWFSAPLRLAFTGTSLAAIFATVFMISFSPDKLSFSDQLAQVNQTEIVNYLVANEQLERQDLTLLNASDRDYTHEFLSLNQAEITQALAEEELTDDNYL